MTLVNINNREVGFEPLPMDAENIELHEEDRPYITYHTGMGTDSYDILKTYLPPGSYKLLFLTSKATWQDWVGIVEHEHDGGDSLKQWYKEYITGAWVRNPIVSGATLLSSLGLEGKNLVVVEKIK